MRNKKLNIRNTSGLSGVRWHQPRGMWQVDIGLNSKLKVIGCYDDFEEAVATRLVTEIILYGEHAPTICRPGHQYHCRALEIREDIQTGGRRFGPIETRVRRAVSKRA